MAINNNKSTSKSGASMELESKVNNSNSLQIQNKAGSKLNPHQIKFNKYIQQIEGLQRKLVTTAKKMDTLFGYYRDHIVPLRADEKRIRPSIIKALFVFYKRKRKELTREQHEQLGDLLRDLFQMSAMEGFDDLENDPEMDIIHKKLYKSTIKESMEEDLEDQISAALFMFRHKELIILQKILMISRIWRLAGMYSKNSSATYGKTSRQVKDKLVQVQIQGRIMVMIHLIKAMTITRRMRISGSGIPAKRRRKKRPLNSKRKSWKRKKKSSNKKISAAIYKQLAKLFHPDLEQDPDKKLEKEMLMKELTVAYAAKDLHTLLRLELSWIQKEENNAAKYGFRETGDLQ